jgi:hypothetical protein
MTEDCHRVNHSTLQLECERDRIVVRGPAALSAEASYELAEHATDEAHAAMIGVRRGIIEPADSNE